MISRRHFIKAAALGATGLAYSNAVKAIPSRQQRQGFFGVHPFIENHPEAVFIMKTSVDHKMNSDAKLSEGLAFGRNVFVPMDEGGIPINVSIPVKPNLKTSFLANRALETIPIQPMKEILGTATDPFFVEGVFEGLKELGINGSQFHMREVNRPENYEKYGYVDMAERVGADLRLDLAPKLSEGLEEGRDYNWTEIPDGIAFKKLPHLEPLNTPGSWLLNISKMKSHLMGMTLCCKNLQGSVAHNYQTFCSNLGRPDVPLDHQCDNVKNTINANYKRHRDENRIPRWDKPSEIGGIWQETWATRTIDHISATPCGLHIIEGIYSRDNDGYFGVHPIDFDHEYLDQNPEAVKVYGKTLLQGKSMTGKAKDYMTNYVIFGMNPFIVDTIGFWLGGHEPGNIGLFHLALERGMTTTFDPSEIPVYVWENGSANLTGLNELKRTPLLTPYLKKDNEPVYHMVDEPFDYSLVDGAKKRSRPAKPGVSILYQQLISPENANASLEYRLPISGFTKLEILDRTGQTVAIPVEDYRVSGIHMANWDTSKSESGKYTYKLRINGHETNGDLSLMK